MGKLKGMQQLFEGRHFDREVIILCVRWYLRSAEPARSGGDDGRAQPVDGVTVVSASGRPSLLLKNTRSPMRTGGGRSARRSWRIRRWAFGRGRQKARGRSPGQHYQTLDLPPADRRTAAKDAGLAMWVYGPRLPDTLALIEAWGFAYDSDLLSWLKITKRGEPRMGTGHTSRKTNEQMLYAIKGAGLKRADRGVRQAILAPRVQHSEKPEAAMAALERLFGPVRRLELFARKHRDGWTCWGNQFAVSSLNNPNSTENLR